MEEILIYRQTMLQKFAGIATEVSVALAALPSETLFNPLVEGSYSPHQAAAHLRDLNDKVYYPPIQFILDTSSHPPEHLDEIAWMAGHYQPEEPLADILQQLQQNHQALIGRLEHLPQSAWSLAERHPKWGVRTLQWWVEQCLAHHVQHLTQIRIFKNSRTG